ncbi:hypothetical protein PSEUBRA_000714 [Kalmanozyma brasiliensis GHG001]|uniref:Mediator of RNA polymerase II transcription subunit 18 n=1 Tax=Kalmanozyma brasiliensis (strain GHG001) TaxID=1365824 RepID=V5EG19_KALBG|nr:uncharacterized protein PSEUBRA_000714 [Kalmanozyma brasiliensis GHG001]EST09501.1 hypothetical protein PSEUBRA_000714 [Kalmanozyma brasiliensis GHG001]
MASRPPATSGSSANANAASSSTANANPSSSKTSTASSQQPQISLLGTLPIHLLPSLLRRIESALLTLPPTLLCERETVLSRHDDETSAVRETGDNAWASVVKARRGVKLRVRETAIPSRSSIECTLHLPLPSLPERQYPRASVRPSYTVQVLSDSPLAQELPSDPFATSDGGGVDPTALDTDPVNGWKSFVSSIGWRPHFSFLRHGLTYALNENLTRVSSTATTNPFNPAQGTKHSLNVYRIFTPDPTGYTDDWVPLDPEGATVVVELVATVGAQLDQSHFNPYCAPAELPGQSGGLDANSTIESAIEFADGVARALRGLVDLRREAYD